MHQFSTNLLGEPGGSLISPAVFRREEGKGWDGGFEFLFLGL
jgi:hypothetical protein